MTSMKALTNHYNNLRSQRIQLEQRTKEALARERAAADTLAVWEAAKDGVVVGGEVEAPYYSKASRMVVVSIHGYGPGQYKARLALPRRDGTPSARTILYRRDDLTPVEHQCLKSD